MRDPVLKALLSILIVVALTGISPAATLNVGSGTATLDGVADPEEWPAEFITTSTGITLKAMVDEFNFYLLANWDDDSGTESIDKKIWSYDGNNWSQSENEDRLGIFWDMGQNDPDGASCVTMCHPPDMSTNYGKVDLWHWKSHRGNPIGYVDDTYADPTGRHGDAGTSTYSDNIDVDQPAFMATGDPGVNATFLLDDGAVTYDPFGVMTANSAVKIVFDSLAAWNTNHHIAGYILRTPAGSRADVMSAGKYDAGTWTVEFIRPIMASADDDFIPVPGGTVDFTVAEFDNAGGTGHATDTNVHTLQFPSFTGVEPTETHSQPEVFRLASNYPNPFNPETVISYQIDKPGTVSLKIYDLKGREVSVLYEGTQNTGAHNLTWQPADLSAGLYFARLSDGTQQSTIKMLYLK